ncbi:uncharacterized protein BCR38DRAFT_357073 [Pseudomassariella vexata]|uniref:Hsp90-like protein n=1 Tax=Pseudomassariella vexata TaxID=1141098 RepID=A0A1Y2D7P1_9PEZI|nr:uncharacterized protein BCR38DRAFT_357073 [Pseudomassariella vexata]ORY55292.1 hypothetical protein BCR38DRAFT_357073 [Pseudomassariella vexata]
MPGIRTEEQAFVDFVNSFKWAATPLGPMSQWPARLQQTFNQVLADSRPIAIYWGPKLATLYNEAFSKLCGTQHPGLLGKSVEDAWPDFCDKIKKTMKASTSKHGPSLEQEWRFFVHQSDGSMEETYLKWSLVPIIENNECMGFLQPLVDTTSMRLWERRMRMLIDLGHVLVTARDTKLYWRKTMQALEACDPSYDIPFAIIYSVENGPSSSHGVTSPDRVKNLCHLEACLGVPKGHPLIPQTLAPETSNQGLSAAFKEALKTQNPTLLHTKDNSLPEALLGGLDWRGFKDPCRSAIICPIRPTTEEHVMGVLVLGLNPRRPYDHDYQQYISLLNQKVTTTLASTVLIQEEARRNRNIAEQAAYDEAQLKEKLAAQTKHATDSMSKFQSIAEFVPVGMCFGDGQGNITFANEAWHRITGVPRTGKITQGSFWSRIVEEDRQNVDRAYKEMERAGAATIEFRVQREDDGPVQYPIGSSPSFEKAGMDLAQGNPQERHVLAALKAECAPDGTILRVLACLTDVTLHKEAAEQAIRRAQLVENYQKMTEFSTVGMYDMSLDGRLVGANNVFFEMCGIDKVDLRRNAVYPFDSCVVEEDVPVLHRALAQLVAGGKTQTAEIRFKTPWTEKDSDGNNIIAPRWVVATFLPVVNSDCVIQSFTGCLIDTSSKNWQFEAERQRYETERKRKDEAIEAKRQQEMFIDMTSHELRNPLSAIVQCADAIIASLAKSLELVNLSPTDLHALRTSPPEAILSEPEKGTWYEGLSLVQNAIENAETIIACTQHQKRIVDDILTMSKMDSNLLTVTPFTVDPILIAKEAFEMFEVEARRVDIELTWDVDQSYRHLGIEFLDLDPSRLKQVLINLLTNALKFTKNQEIRKVSIKMSASKQRPTDATSSVQFIPRAADILAPETSTSDTSGSGPSPRTSETSASEPSTSSNPPDYTYLIFEVHDTGQGLTEEEKSLLFQRFVQASPKTHVKYGGSGLGLFISKRLTEMQGGAIGVASRPGHGSTFAFYIEANTPGKTELQEARAAADALKQAMRSPSTVTRERAASGRANDVQIEGVLIVEDNLINQQITRRGLLDRGKKVEVANHGLEALEKLQKMNQAEGEFPLTLVTMDMEMPIQDGLTCTREIRKMELSGQLKGPRIPILAVSANARTEQIKEAIAAGCDDVLVKPYRIDELSHKMRMAVQKSREREDQERKEDEIHPS